MTDQIVIADITSEQLDEMVGDGRAKIESIMTGQWKITIDGKDVGTVLTDTFKDETTVTLGERVIGRFTDR